MLKKVKFCKPYTLLEIDNLKKAFFSIKTFKREVIINQMIFYPCSYLHESIMSLGKQDQIFLRIYILPKNLIFATLIIKVWEFSPWQTNSKNITHNFFFFFHQFDHQFFHLLFLVKNKESFQNCSQIIEKKSCKRKEVLNHNFEGWGGRVSR